MITGSVYVDLTREPSIAGDDQGQDRRALDVLDRCPAGSHVVVDIGEREFVTRDAATWLGRNAERLLIEVRGTDLAAVTRFVRAGRAGDWSVIP